MDNEPTEASKLMDPEWSLAAVQQAHAYHFGDDYVSIHIAGDLPDACHVVDMERNLLTVDPPEFIARWYIRQDVACPDVVTPYAYQEVFHVGEKLETVKLRHAGGVLDIQVAERTTILAWPFGRPREATGYSDAFDFAEAFRDAIAQLSETAGIPDIPDWLWTYQVVSTGAEIGGIAGFNRMYVRVRGTVWP